MALPLPRIDAMARTQSETVSVIRDGSRGSGGGHSDLGLYIYICVLSQHF